MCVCDCTPTQLKEARCFERKKPKEEEVVSLKTDVDDVVLPAPINSVQSTFNPYKNTHKPWL